MHVRSAQLVRPSLAPVALLLLAVTLLACGPADQGGDPTAAEDATAGEVQRYQLRGKVIRLEPENKAALIEHEEIVGWMDAMSMRFPVRDDAEWAKLSEGGTIDATVFVNDDGFYIGEIEVSEGEEPSEEAQ